jgi:SAM-dependent methyltransferase
MSDMDPQKFYDEFGETEWERLDANPVTRMEFENTVAYLDEHLPGSGRVLDAGGGPGRYSAWLAERGYEVTHCDLSAEQVRLARETVADRGVGDRVACHQADVRDLPFATDRFDAVCCLGGPISHVTDADERAGALRELRRVAVPGAPTFVSVIGRLASVRDAMKNVLPEESGERHGFLDVLAHDGDYTQELVDEHAGDGWAECHFYRADELRADLAAAGFDATTLAGLEGPASNLGAELAAASDAAVEEVRAVVADLREDPAVVDFSEHILAVCLA